VVKQSKVATLTLLHQLHNIRRLAEASMLDRGRVIFLHYYSWVLGTGDVKAVDQILNVVHECPVVEEVIHEVDCAVEIVFLACENMGLGIAPP
jgi:hypothetical protein